MNIRMIAAITENYVIGSKGEILWDMPADIAFFKQEIKIGWLLTGRKSLESAQGSEIFTGRTDVIVVTRQPNYSFPPFLIAHSIEEALVLAREKQIKILNILGGGVIYKAMMPFAHELIITKIYHSFEGDAFFPEISTQEWHLKSKRFYFRDAQNPFDYSFNWYVRK